MELQKGRADKDAMPKRHSRRAAFASALVLAAGLMGCMSSAPPPARTVTVCDSFGMPPRDRLRERFPQPYSQADRMLAQPQYFYINCVTVEER